MILTRVSSGKNFRENVDIFLHFVRLRKMRTFQSVSRNKKCEDFAKENIMQKYRDKIQNLIKKMHNFCENSLKKSTFRRIFCEKEFLGIYSARNIKRPIVKI